MTIQTQVLNKRWIYLAAFTALLLRILHLWFLYREDPLLLTPQIDAEAYHLWALSILKDPIGQKVFFQSPAYPYTLAIFYKIFGASIWIIAIIQTILGALSCILIARVVSHIAPPKYQAASIIAAWILALYQPLIFYDALLLKVGFANFFTLLFLDFYARGLQNQERSKRLLFGAGFFLAFLGLYRGNFYLAFPILALWILSLPILQARQQKGSKAPWISSRSLGQTLAFVAGFFLVLGLILTRNVSVSGQWVMTTAGGGTVLYYGNNPHSPKGDFAHIPFVRSSPKFEEVDFRAEAERRNRRIMTTSEADRYWRDQAVSYILKNPIQTAQRVFNKLLLTVQAHELGDNYSIKFHSLFSPILWFLFPWWALLLALASAWLLPRSESRLNSAPIVLILLVYLGSLMIFFVSSRYRIPMVPMLVILASIEICRLWKNRKSSERRPFLLHLLLIVCVASLSLGLGQEKHENEKLGIWWSYLASRHIEKGDRKKGISIYKKALQYEPKNGIIWMNLGRLYLDLNKYPLAAKLCHRAILLKTGHKGASECLSFAFFKQKKYGAALKALQPVVKNPMPLNRYLLLTAIYEGAGRLKPATNVLLQAARYYSQNAVLYAHLARLLRKQGSKTAQNYLDKALSLTKQAQRKAQLHKIAGF